MLLANQRIMIIGAGPGGLTLARLLQLKGLDIKVYERDADQSVRQQGATLDLHQDSGLKALEAAGLMDAFRRNYRPNAGKMRVADKNLAIYIDDHESGEGYTEIRPEIDRGPLRDMLIDSLEPGTIVWNSHFVSMKKIAEGQGWDVQFKDGRNAYADLVIAADGANSRVRPYITPIQPIYSGITILEGTVYHAERNAPEMWSLTKEGKAFVLGDEKSIILSSKGDGALTFYMGCKVAQDWAVNGNIDFSDIDSLTGWFEQNFSDWDPAFRELITADLTIFPRVMYHCPLDQHWEAQPDLTMIGDAAHRMPPYAGEGVNMAMLDAFVLAEKLAAAEFSSIRQAVASFESEMLQRAAVMTEVSLDNTRRLHEPDAIRQMQMVMAGN